MFTGNLLDLRVFVKLHQVVTVLGPGVECGQTRGAFAHILGQHKDAEMYNEASGICLGSCTGNKSVFLLTAKVWWLPFL